MSEPQPALKEIFDRARLRHFAAETKAIWPAFDDERFVALATDRPDDLGIMQRMWQTAVSLQATLPQDYPAALDVLTALAPRINHGFASITLSEFVALYGLEHFDRSMAALRYFTRYGSAEFAIRHFLARDLARTLAVMRGWADDDNEHVRRLASEGSRPRLPWSFQLKPIIADPSLTMPILEALKGDPSLYVRKSVANHLNDFSKDHPDWLLDRLQDWPTTARPTDWIVRHALRTLIKKGEPRALSLIGTTGKAEVRIDTFKVSPTKIRLGDRIALTVTLTSTADRQQRLVADYAVYYVKKGEKPSRKVFKLKELDLPAREKVDLAISQVVRDFTTRKHYAGFHRVELMVNGDVLAESGFTLHI
ncbi:MAG: DNA alkylation repair protein [Rhizobiaceae bacterium]